MKSQKLAKHLRDIGQMYQYQPGAERKAGTYARAASALAACQELPEDLTTLKGIGPSIAKTILEFANTGSSRVYRSLDNERTWSIKSLTRVSGIGPTQAASIYDNLGVKSPDELLEAINAGQAQKYARYFDAVVKATQTKSDTKYPRPWLASTVADFHAAFADQAPETMELHSAGSWRRHVEACSDLDFVCTVDIPWPNIIRSAEIMEAQQVLRRVYSIVGSKAFNFTGHGQMSYGSVSRKHVKDLPVRVAIVAKYTLGTALMHYTGPVDHVEVLCDHAEGLGYSLSRWGVWDGDQVRVQVEAEPALYDLLKLRSPSPIEREVFGAHARMLPYPELTDDVSKDLGVYTSATEGTLSPMEVVKVAVQRGLTVVGLIDWVNDIEDFADYTRKVTCAKQKASSKGIELLVAGALRIQGDGTVNFDKDRLRFCDYIVLCINTDLGVSSTERYLEAMNVVHTESGIPPIGFILNAAQRHWKERPHGDPDIDWFQVVDAAAHYGCAFAVSAHPHHMDLPKSVIEKVVSGGGKVAIISGTKNRSVGLVETAVSQAARAGVLPGSIATTEYLSTEIDHEAIAEALANDLDDLDDL